MKLKLTIDGKVYEVEVEAEEPESPRPILAPPSAAVRTPPGVASSKEPAPRSSPPAAVDERKVCRSPIAGIVVRVSAQVGQSIKPNDVLLVLEAMKMETVITAPVAGTVAKVHVAAGDSVQARQVLVEFE